MPALAPSLLALVLIAPWAVGVSSPAVAQAMPVAAGSDQASTALAALPAWDGSINLYRAGVFTTQKTWYYCTPADVQIIRNIVRHEEDHSRAAQDRYFSYMRNHMRYAIPVKHGVDPAGWTAGLRRFVDDRYRLIVSPSFRSLIRSAVRNLRRTNLPVALFVDRGNHGWVLNGFTATADPAVTSDFKVLTVRVTGPLWGRQNTTYGYDMKPNKKLTRAQLKDFVKKWHYAPIRMVWEGQFLSIQPVASLTTATAASDLAPTAEPAPSPTLSPTPTVPPTIASAGSTAGDPDEPTASPGALSAAGAASDGDPPGQALGIVAMAMLVGSVAIIALRRRPSVRGA